MLTTLVAVLCHSLSGIPAPVCVDEIVTDTNYEALAGKVDDPVGMDGMTWHQCQIEGQQIASKWMAEHPIYRTWRLQGWKCVPGHYEPAKRA